MAPYYPLYIRRSDGKVTLSSKTAKGTPNQPTPEQLDQSPDSNGVCDYYREVTRGETKEVDWRRKLAGMLIREIDKNYILAALPENYRVYEHVKCKISEIDGKPQKTSKNHAAGSNERQDAYLYGHPSGPKKRYRSPAEFFPHLLWLATDVTGDNDNCSCKFCSPEELEEDKIPKGSSAKDSKSAQAKNSDATKPTASNATQRKVLSTEQGALMPSPLPQPTSYQQNLDAQHGRFLYRPGEIVWFARGAAWGLGVVVRREMTPYQQQAQCHYSIQPLSHPFHHPQQLNCTQEQLRPWLAWSPPPLTITALNTNPNNPQESCAYDAVDWRRVLSSNYGHGDPEVDGSILAVKAVERTFCLINEIPPPGSAAARTKSYAGMYLGAERIWVGEAVRLRHSNAPTDMFVLHAITELPAQGNGAAARVTVTGDIYSYRITQLEPNYSPQHEMQLPARVLEDLRFRNTVTSRHPDASKRYTSFWKLQSVAQTLELGQVKGRWYESSRMLPLLDKDNFNASCARGEINDVGLWMNGQGDCNRSNTDPKGQYLAAHVKTLDRQSAFGRSIPPGLHIDGAHEETKPEGPRANNGTGLGEQHYSQQHQSITQENLPRSITSSNGALYGDAQGMPGNGNIGQYVQDTEMGSGFGHQLDMHNGIGGPHGYQ